MIYLDSAATSLLKPESVHYAALEAMCQAGSPGRGSHDAALRASELCYDCREAVADLFRVPSPEQVVFTFNATHALNIAIHSLVKPGDTVVVSGYEHNAVMRPLYALNTELRIVRTPLFDPDAMLEEFRLALDGADAAVFTHVSNVFGYILPLEQLAALCREKGVPFIVDASQSAGVLDVDFSALDADFLAMPGHKGLLGPQGTGILLCKGGAEPLLYGGSGSRSRAKSMPPFLPDRLEAGTHNVCGVAGLHAGIRYLQRRGLAAIRQQEQKLLEMTVTLLREQKDLFLYDSSDAEIQSGVLSLRPLKRDCEWLAEALSAEGVAVRAGLQCAPCAHETVGTLSTGTVRLSFSPFNREDEVLQLADIFQKILKKI